MGLTAYYRIPEIAKYFGVVPATARRWFETTFVKGEAPHPIDGVIAMPAGSQRPRYLIPPEIANQCLRAMKIPEDQLRGLAEAHALSVNGHNSKINPKVLRSKKPKQSTKARTKKGRS